MMRLNWIVLMWFDVSTASKNFVNISCTLCGIFCLGLFAFLLVWKT